MNARECVSPPLRILAACDRGDVKIVKSLLDQGVNVNARDKGECALFRAAKCGHVQVIKVLLEHGANVNATDGCHKWSALMTACQIDCLSAIQLLLEYGANVNIRGKCGLSALFIATQQGSIETVKVLLIYGADVNVQDNSGRSVLMAASVNNYGDIVKLLLVQRATVRMKDINGWSALMIVSHYGYTELVSLLLRYGANVNDAVNGWSALMIATQNNNIKTAQVLLEYGANVNEQIGGVSALMIVCKYGYSELANILLERDANISLRNSRGLTALMIARQQGHTTILELLMQKLNDLFMNASKNGHAKTVHLLLKQDACTNVKDADGKTALMFASEKGYTKTVKVLLEYGADANMQDIFKKSALMNASTRGYSKTVKMLLKHGADANMQDKFRESALIFASYNGHIKTAKMLLNHGADVNMEGFDGLTALFYACQKSWYDIATLLIKHGACLDCHSKTDGKTILMFAIQRKDIETVKQLLEFGANVDIQDKNGQTALIVATEKGSFKTVELLIEFGANVDIQDKNGHTALITATENRITETVKLLIKSCAIINVQNKHGRTALMKASERGYSDIVTILLLFHKANVNIQDEDGWTALMLACQHGYTEIADYLIEYGADVNLAKNDGWTALTLAKINHRTATAELLNEYGAMDAIPKKKGLNNTYTSTYTATGTEDSGYGPSAEHTLSDRKASKVNSTVISVTTSEQYFSWEGHGLHLCIPEGALPLEMQPCVLSIEASVEGNYIFPENCHLVSAVYWFRCAPACKFLRPIILEIQHCAKQHNLQALSFVKARSFEDQFNKALDCYGTKKGEFPSHSSYGFIELDGFSRYGVVQEGSEDRQYRANLYYIPQSVNQCQIHFAVLWNTDTHHSVIKRYYLQQNAEVGPDKPVEFDSESISLDIPMKGITTEDGMWKIFPLTFPPEVAKREVDSFDVGKRIPASQLQAITQKSQHHEITNLIYPLKLLGTKSCHDYITLFRSPGNTSGTLIQQQNDIYRDCTYQFSQGAALNPLSSVIAKFSAQRPRSYEGIIATGASPVQPYPLQSNPFQGATFLQSQSAILSPPIIANSENQESHEVVQSQPLHIHPLQESMAATFHHSLTTPQVQAFAEPPRFTTLVHELTNRVAAKWEEIGSFLHLEPGLLEIIKKDNPSDCRACLKEMLKEWMKQVDPPPSWAAIIKAVKDCGHNLLARTLRSKYLLGTMSATLS